MGNCALAFLAAHQMPKRPRLILLILIGIVLLVTSSRMMLASFWGNQVNSFLIDWEQHGVEPESEAWQVAYEAANKAITLSPVADAEYYNYLGRVWEWQQFTKKFGDSTAQASRQNALIAYRQAVALRPQWPYTWVSLAYTKLRLLQIDEEFMHALNTAAKYSPWRIKSNKRVAEIGLMAWFDLDQATKRTVITAIQRTVNFNVNEARWLEKRATQSNQLLILCGVIEQEMRVKLKGCVH
ncbi:MAG: hypothetical protein COB22_02305 [Cycloclasticus sp.]|nr:MAG: hypothetical protein COB22_02305 [Cycloclasticus sp.]